jgi:hypothetical protein
MNGKLKILLSICVCLVVLDGALGINIGNASARLSVQEDNTCTLCKLVISLVEDFIAENATEDAIVKFLDDDVCPLLKNFFPVETVASFCY